MTLAARAPRLAEILHKPMPGGSATSPVNCCLMLAPGLHLRGRRSFHQRAPLTPVGEYHWNRCTLSFALPPAPPSSHLPPLPPETTNKHWWLELPPPEKTLPPDVRTSACS